MSQSLSCLLTHIIFSTKDRYPFLADPAIRREMHAYLATAFTKEKCPALLIGGTSDHVHILCNVGRTICVADILKEVKRQSSLWVQGKGGMLAKFAWQAGYGAFSIGQSGVDNLKKYIHTQEEHRGLLKKYEIDYDERYVWD